MTNQDVSVAPPTFGDFIVYADESGTHNLEAVEPHFPVFVLSLCVFRKTHYVDSVVPDLQRMKLKWFGHDMVVFHEREIRKQIAPFAFLANVNRRDKFMQDINEIMMRSSMTVIAAAIDKRRLKQRYATPSNPYDLALTFCLERLWAFLGEAGARQATTHCVFECRGKAEDRELELAFRRIADGENFQRVKMPGLSIIFADKKVNSTGLQIADLTARPIGLHVIRPEQPNRAFQLIEPKLRTATSGYGGVGLKIFP